MFSSHDSMDMLRVGPAAEVESERLYVVIAPETSFMIAYRTTIR